MDINSKNRDRNIPREKIAFETKPKTDQKQSIKEMQRKLEADIYYQSKCIARSSQDNLAQKLPEGKTLYDIMWS